MKIYGDANSGNCLKVKWVCDKLALPYSWIEIDTLKGGSRTADFLKLNGWGQVPTVELDDGRILAQSNAIIRYLARGSGLIPSDPYSAAQMDAWMFWEQNTHEPYVAVCRFQTVYLGKAVADLDPNLVKRGYVALDHLERHLGGSRFLIGEAFSLADVSLLAYTRVAHEGGLDLDRYPVINRWIGDSERVLGLPPARRHPTGIDMTSASSVTIRRARRDDVAAIVGMLADDPLGSGRERIEDPLPQIYYQAFERVERDPNLQLVVAVDGEGAVVGCLQLVVMAGLSSQGTSRGLLEDVRVAKHCRSRGIGEQLVRWAVTEARAKGCALVELLTHHTRVDAQRFYERLGFARSHVGMTLRF